MPNKLQISNFDIDLVFEILTLSLSRWWPDNERNERINYPTGGAPQQPPHLLRFGKLNKKMTLHT